MTVYAIGDVQGCYTQLQKLLEKLAFEPHQDKLWFTGDLVNRGPDSLAVLRFVKDLPQAVTVLGNHDLHLIALAVTGLKPKDKDTLHPVLAAKDCEELIAWLRHQPLLHYDKALDFALSHAGIAPQWTLDQALSLAHEVEQTLQSNEIKKFATAMYGNEPPRWTDDLQGIPRFRCIVNYFTRMRYCYADGRLQLEYKGPISQKPDDLIPWFQVPNRKNSTIKIIFGHWASLGGRADTPNIYPLDTGCVWGNCLTAMNLSDSTTVSVPCP